MSSVQLQKTGADSANVVISACKLGAFLTRGRTQQLSMPIKDSENVRLLSANLSKLKNENFQGVVNIKFSESERYSMDQSIWRDLADALFGFTLCVDLAKMGI